MPLGTTYGSREAALAEAIVDQMVARGLGVGGGTGGGSGGGSGGVDNSSSISQIYNSIGEITSPTAYQLSSGESDISWNLVSLLRGIFDYSKLSYSSLIDVKINTEIQNYSTSINLQDFSGVIDSPNTSSSYTQGVTYRKYLFIQNLPIAPLGNLWINFSAPATVGSGSLLLAPGETFVMEGTATVAGEISLLGTVQGMQFTYKEG